jgi:glycosyltransferase involved in cell wall biosynthesis
MRILYICDRLPTFILNEIIELKSRGHEIFILASDSSRLYKAVHEPIVKKNGLDKQFHRFFIIKNRKQKYGNFLKWLMRDVFVHPICATKACWYLIRKYPHLKYGVIDYLDIRSLFGSGIDIIHSPFSTPRIIDKVYLLSKILHVPFTLCFRAHDLYHRNNMHEATKRIAVIKEAARIVTIAVYNRDNINKNLAIDKDIEIVHSAIDPGVFRAKEVSRSHKSIIAVSRLDDQKGIIYLIQACHILHTRGIEYECTIIGEGPEKKACQEFIAEQRIPNMHLIDYLPNEAVKDHLNHATVFVLPCEIAPDGKRDVLANALKEAMAMQVPVITSNVCGIEELVDNGINGLLVPPQNPEAIADAIATIMNHPDQRKAMGKKAREKIENFFNIQTEVQKLEEIFSRAVTHATMEKLP